MLPSGKQRYQGHRTRRKRCNDGKDMDTTNRAMEKEDLTGWVAIADKSDRHVDRLEQGFGVIAL